MSGKAADTPWSLKGVSPEVRKLARRAADRAGVSIGVWLSAAIREAGEAERRQREGRARPEAARPASTDAAAAPTVERRKNPVQRLQYAAAQAAGATPPDAQGGGKQD